MQEWLESVTRARQGDAAAFDGVVREFQDMAVGYAYSVLRDFQLAEDAAQEAFVAAYLCLGGLREPASFPAWFRKIVYKQCDRIFRKKQHPTVPLDAALGLADSGPSPFDTVNRRETSELVLEAVTALPDQERTATTLAYINGYSLAEVGDFLEVSVDTVKNRLRSARNRLRERMVGLVEETLKQHAPGDQFGAKVGRILEGIEKIGWETTSALCFTGSVAASMRFLGDQVQDDYVMGISGGAFKMFWIPPWSPANCDLLIIGEEPIRRTFAALGYDYDYSYFGTVIPANDRGRYRGMIVSSIDAGRPVIAEGIVGPPEACVVSGYDRGGSVLYGRSYFQEEPEGYFRAEGWEENCQGLLFIGDRRSAPSRRQVLRDTLKWAIELARVPERQLFQAEATGPQQFALSGMAAYDAMVDGLLRDADFLTDDLETVRSYSFAIANDGICLMMCKRGAADRFLRSMAEDGLPGADDLSAAAELYAREAAVWARASEVTPGSWSAPEELLKLRDPELRRRLGTLVMEAKAIEEQAVQHLESAHRALTAGGE